MKFAKNVFAFALMFAFAFSMSGEETNDELKDENDKDKGAFSLSLDTAGAYYFLSDYITGGTHYSKITSPFDGLELKTTLCGSYTIPTPLGENWLVNGAYVSLNGNLEVSPVTFKPEVSVSFSPLPFLIFRAGGSFGIGWNIDSMGWEGLSQLNEKVEYEGLTPFKNNYYELFAEGTFQFDTGAIFPGDWTHVVMQAIYNVYYHGITGMTGDDIWEWQCGKNHVNGMMFKATGVLAYQMPLPLYRVGVMGVFEGYLNEDSYPGSVGKDFDGDYVRIDISPMLTLAFGKNDSVNVLFSFANRRSFSTPHETVEQEVMLEKTGSEWYFRRIVFLWSHRFL